MNTIMTAFNKLIGKDHPAPNDFVVDFFMPQDPGYQNLVGAKQTNLPDPGDRTVVTFSKVDANTNALLQNAKLRVAEENGPMSFDYTTGDSNKRMYLLRNKEYVLSELNAPDGYEIASPISFRITGDGNVEVGSNGSWALVGDGTVVMRDVPLAVVTVTFSKTAVNGTEELRGASLKVVKGEKEDGALVEEWISTGEQKKIKLEVGTYTMVETTAPAGYEIAESITFRITDKGRVEIKDSNNWIQQRDAQIHMKDAPTPTPETPEPKTTEVIFSKTAVNGTEELPGAELKITRNADKKLVSSWISSTLPKAFTLERDVEYTMTEIQAPKGYELAESIVFRITKEGKVEIKEGDAWVAQKEAKVKMEDALSDEPKPESKTLEVHFSKVEVNGTKELPGAELKITRNGDKKLIASWISSSTAKSFTLERGVEYTMREIQAPKGYAIAENIVFRITDDGKVEIYEGKTWVAQKDAKVVMEDALLKTLPGTGQKGGNLFVLAIAVLLLAIILLGLCQIVLV